jgi:Abortive infection alpha
MTAEWLPALAKAASDPGLLKEVYGDLAKPGVSQVGKALGTVLGLGNTCLWPIQLLNERARVVLEMNLESLRQRLASLPHEKVVAISPEVGVPAAEKLSYVTDVDLRELYINLLAKAANIDMANQAHPGFVNVINSLSPDEAILLKQLANPDVTPYVGAKFLNPSTQHFHQIVEVHIAIDERAPLRFPWNLPAYISNLEGLGLINVSLSFKASDFSQYGKLEGDLRERYKHMTAPEGFTQLAFDQGRILVTRYAKLFLSACLS